MKNLGLIGYPLKKTLSPDIFRFLFKKRKIRGRYKVLRIPPKTLPRVFKKLACFDGLNVTTPYKTKFLCFCHSLIGDAGLIKAVNTLKNENGKFIGYNTDVFGFKKGIQSIGFNPKNKKCCVFGSGGAARAVIFALFSMGAESIKVVSRNTKKARLNLSFLKSMFCKSKLSFSAKAPTDYHIYINATPLSNSYFPLKKFPKQSVFFDLNYSISKTPFLKMVQRLGATRITDGKEMLFYQAVASFMIWTGEKINFKEMEKLQEEFYGPLMGGMRRLKNIYLVGFAGSGKTETGRILARKLRRIFYDTDIEIEKSEKKKVSEIIRVKGLGYFRKKEKQILKNLAIPGGFVISLGGGITLSRNNGFSLTEKGICIFLDCNIGLLKKRLSKNPHLHPLICTNNGQISVEKIRALYFKRLKYYKNANIHIKTGNLKPEQLAEKIIHILKKNNEI